MVSKLLISLLLVLGIAGTLSADTGQCIYSDRAQSECAGGVWDDSGDPVVLIDPSKTVQIGDLEIDTLGAIGSYFSVTDDVFFHGYVGLGYYGDSTVVSGPLDLTNSAVTIGNFRIESSLPTLSFGDKNENPLQTDGLIELNSLAQESTFTFKIDAGGSYRLVTAMTIAGTDPGNIDILMGDPVGGNYTNTDETGALTSVGTSTVKGLVDVTLDTSDSEIVLTPLGCQRGWRINNDADLVDYLLPTAATGLECCFLAAAAGLITVDANTADEIILDGTGVGVGDAIDSNGTAGDVICLLAVDTTNWFTHSRTAVWIDGGAD